jgi:type IX secretion system PorP/SprF family membrane protein
MYLLGDQLQIMKKGFIFIAALFSNMLMTAQDNYFAQYNTSKTNTNPAFTGSDSTLVLSSAATFQFPIAEKDDKLFFSADNYFRRLRGGLGINLSRESDAGGALITSRVSIAYAPHFEFFEHRLVVQPALSVGLFQRSIDWSQFTFGDMIDAKTGFVYDAKEPANLSTKSNIDFSTGILLYTKRFYGGFAVHHFNEPDEGLLGPGKLPARITLHGGANLTAGSFILSPNVMYQQQQNFSMILLGVTARYEWLVAGIAYRDNNGIVSTAGLQNRFFKISYSYYFINPAYYINEVHFNWFFKHRKVSKVQSIRLI